METPSTIYDPWIESLLYEFDLKVTLHFLEFEMKTDAIFNSAKDRLDEYEAFSIGSRPDIRLNHMIAVLGFFGALSK